MSVTIEELRQEGRKSGYPLFKAGQTVRVHYEVKEGDKTRIQIFEGLIISVNGKKELGHSIVVRRVHNGFVVEQGFAVHSPHIKKIELVKVGKVRQSRIFYMRQRQGKSARLKEKFYSDAEISELIKSNN